MFQRSDVITFLIIATLRCRMRPSPYPQEPWQYQDATKEGLLKENGREKKHMTVVGANQKKKKSGRVAWSKGKSQGRRGAALGENA